MRAAAKNSLCAVCLVAVSATACSDAEPTARTVSPAPASPELALEWGESGPDSGTPRYEAQGLALGGKLYVFGGFVQGSGWPVTTGGEVFDLDTLTWTARSPAPEALTHAARATDGQFIYFAGGFIGDGPGGSTDHTWRYDPVSDSWQAMAPLPEERGAGALALVGTTLHYFGGAVRPPDEDIIASDHGEHWALDSADPTAEWTTLAPMPTPRNHLGGCAVGGIVYAVGGQNLHDEQAGNLANVDAYDPERDEWQSATSLPIPMGHLTSNTLEYRGRVLVISGITQGSTKLKTVFSFDPTLGQWTELESLPEPRHSPVSAIVGDTLIVAGGSLSTSREIRAQTWLGALRLE